MKRSQFLGLFAIPLLPKIDLSDNDNKSVFNVKKLKERIEFLKKCTLKPGQTLILLTNVHLENYSDSQAITIQNVIQEKEGIRIFIQASDHFK